MDDMTYEKALNILGLSKGFSEAELKKAYRRLAMKYHPDRNPGNKDAELKFKESGAAYEFLKVDKNKPDFSYGTNNISFMMYKGQAIGEMHSYLNGLNKLVNHELSDAIKTYSKEIDTLIKKYESVVQNCLNMKQLEYVYEEFKNSVKLKLKIISDAFLNKNPYFKSLNIKFNYSLNAYRFVLYLDKLKKELLDKLNKEIRKIVADKYSLYAGYEQVKEDIDLCINECVANIISGSAKDVELENLNNKIESIFQGFFEYSSRKEELKELLELIEGLDSVILKQRVDKLSENIDNPDFYDEIDYLMFQAKSIKSGEYVGAIKMHLDDKFSQAIRGSLDEKERKTAFNIYNDAVSLLERVPDGFINFDIVSYLFRIKFEDLELDRKLLDVVLNKTDKINTGYVYVAKDAISSFGYLYFKDEGYQMKYRSCMGNSTLKAKTYADVAEDFVSLSLFLANAKFVGKLGFSSGGSYVSILYEYDSRLLVLSKKGVIYVLPKNNVSLLENKKISPEIEQYRDKKLVLEKISEVVHKDLVKKKKRY